MYLETYSKNIRNLFRGSFLVGGIPAQDEYEGPGRLGIESGLPDKYYLYKKVLIAETVVAGLEFHAGRLCAERLTRGEWLKLERERTNRYDRFAVRVCTRSGRMIGYVPRFASRYVAGELDRGNRVYARIQSAGTDGRRLIVSLYAYRPSMLNAG